MKNTSEFIEKDALAFDISGAIVSGDKSMSTLGVEVCSLTDGLAKYGDVIDAQFVNLNGFLSGLFIFLREGVVLQNPIYIVGSKELPHNIYVMAEADASASIVFVASAGNVSRTVVVGDRAKVVLHDIVMADSRVQLDSVVSIAQGGLAEVVTVECGSAETQLVYREVLAGAEASVVHHGIFMAADGEHKGVSVRVEHLVANCRSNVLIKGVASATGRGAFDGMVYVAPDAQKTEAYQQSRNILIGEQARIITSPQLEIYADDVKCSHGATVGQMSDDAVYYMRQRGLSDAEARGLQLAGFVNDIVAHLGSGTLADKVVALAIAKIEQL